uniref:Uncharacterized protein n=1 Tax=Anguilla anguilla TaxID=7936 RepID=A0A0E9UC22_ANGAN
MSLKTEKEKMELTILFKITPEGFLLVK